MKSPAMLSAHFQRAGMSSFCQALSVSLLVGYSSIASAQQQDGEDGSNLVSGSTLIGYESPDPLPGYEPSLDPRDFRGVWTNRPLESGLPFNIAPPVPFTDRARRMAEHRREMEAAGTTVANNHIMCRPTGANQMFGPIAPIYILQNEEKIVFIVTDEIRDVRHVYFDMDHPDDLEPTYGGHSIAHWDGDTLVVDTTGFNGTGEINKTLHSDKLHVTQRITKSADGRTLSIDTTLVDPETFTEPLTVEREWVWLPGRQPLEFDCEENPREDNFADMVFEAEYLRPICIRYEGEGEQLSYVRCEAP